MNTILKLALSRITIKKARSFVIGGSILLTTVLFMTVVCISINLLTGYSLMLRLSSGTDFHGYLRTHAFSLSAMELKEKALQDKNIKDVSITCNVMQVGDSPDILPYTTDTIRIVETERDLSRFYLDITDGTFPADDTEVLVNDLYYPNAAIGDTIELYYVRYMDSVSMPEKGTFTVSGFFHSRSEATGIRMLMRYSDTLAETYHFPDRYMNLYFTFDNNINLTGKLDILLHETLSDYLLPDYEVHGVLNNAYLEADLAHVLNPSTILLILISVSVVFFCSFLLIYNIYAIALTQDMTSFGLLSVIGTTYKQMRRLICVECSILLGITLPFGLVLGYFIGWKMLTPLLMSGLQYEGLTFSFRLWMPVLTILLTFVTLVWSATRPLQKLKTMSPMAAVDYSPAADLSGRYIRQKNNTRLQVPTPGRIARFTLSRHRRKTTVSALSMTLSVVLMMVFSAIGDYLIANTERYMQAVDYVLKVSHTYTYGETKHTTAFAADGGVGFPADVVEAVQNSVYADRFWQVRTTVTTVATPVHAREELGVLRNRYQFFESYPNLTKAMNGTLDVLVVGIPDELFGELELGNGTKLRKTDGYEAYGVYDGFRSNGFTDSAHTEPYPFRYFHASETVTFGDTTIPLLVSDTVSPVERLTNWIGTGTLYRAIVYLPESRFLSIFGAGETYALLLDAKEDCYDLLRTELLRYTDGWEPVFGQRYETYLTEQNERIEESPGLVIPEILSWSVDIAGRLDGMEQIQNTVFAIRTVGYSLVGLIFLIGVLNIVNTALTSVTERKREFAMLEAVGMTNRQLCRMLLLESLYSGTAALGMTVLVGFPLLVLLTDTAMDGLILPDFGAGCMMLGFCLGVLLLSGLFVWRLVKRDSVVERVKVE